MKRWVTNHLGRTLFFVEHDFVMAAAMADKVVVYEGTPGVKCVARSPCSVADGFNTFLKNLDGTCQETSWHHTCNINTLFKYKL